MIFIVVQYIIIFTVNFIEKQIFTDNSISMSLYIIKTFTAENNKLVH